jgi:hypothetical protein
MSAEHNRGPVWTGSILEVDIDVTRRKRFHYLLDPHGNVLSVDRRMSDALKALRTHDIAEVLVLTEKTAYILKLRECSEHHPINGGSIPWYVETQDTKHHG